MTGKSIAIILARGGSKRLPRKNVTDFFGKPMVAWSIEAALESGCFDRVLVSTDDPEIAEIGRKYGAEVPFLRNGAADDHATSSEASIVALEQAERHWNETYDVVAQLLASCPLRTASDIRECVNEFRKSGACSQISCFDVGWSRPWWAAQLAENGEPSFLFSDALSKRSQDLPTLYCPSGAFWIARRGGLLSAGSFYMDGHRWNPIRRISAMDIDEKEDLALARAYFQAEREGTAQSE